MLQEVWWILTDPSSIHVLPSVFQYGFIEFVKAVDFRSVGRVYVENECTQNEHTEQRQPESILIQLKHRHVCTISTLMWTRLERS